MAIGPYEIALAKLTVLRDGFLGKERLVVEDSARFNDTLASLEPLFNADFSRYRLRDPSPGSTTIGRDEALATVNGLIEHISNEYHA